MLPMEAILRTLLLLLDYLVQFPLQTAPRLTPCPQPPCSQVLTLAIPVLVLMAQMRPPVLKLRKRQG